MPVCQTGTPPPGWPRDKALRPRHPAERGTVVILFVIAGLLAAVFSLIGFLAAAGNPAVMLLAAGIVLASALPFAVAALRLLKRIRRIREAGIEARGTVRYAWLYLAGPYRAPEAALAVEFDIGDKTILAVQAHPHWYNAAPPGTTVLLRYHPEDPRCFTILRVCE